jgi:hypothetical protein
MSDKIASFSELKGHVSDAHHDAVLEQIHKALQGLRFGSVLLIVQDGVVVQIERTEKKRLARPGNGINPKEH